MRELRIDSIAGVQLGNEMVPPRSLLCVSDLFCLAVVHYCTSIENLACEQHVLCSEPRPDAVMAVIRITVHA